MPQIRMRALTDGAASYPKPTTAGNLSLLPSLLRYGFCLPLAAPRKSSNKQALSWPRGRFMFCFKKSSRYVRILSAMRSEWSEVRPLGSSLNFLEGYDRAAGLRRRSSSVHPEIVGSPTHSQEGPPQFMEAAMHILSRARAWLKGVQTGSGEAKGRRIRRC